MNMYVIKVSIAEHIQLNFNSNVDFTNSKLWKIFIKEDGSTVHSREYQKILSFRQFIQRNNHIKNREAI